MAKRRKRADRRTERTGQRAAPPARPRPRPARTRLIAAVRAAGELPRRDALAVASASTIQRAVADGALVRVRRGRAASYSATVAAPAPAPARAVAARRQDVRGVPGGRLHALQCLVRDERQTLGQRMAEATSLIGW